MMRNLALLGALVLCVSCSSIKGGSGKTVYREGEPIATHVPDGDPEMAAAEAKARETMPEFMAELKEELSKPAGTSKLMFAIKSKFSADGQDEHMWSDAERHLHFLASETTFQYCLSAQHKHLPRTGPHHEHSH